MSDRLIQSFFNLHNIILLSLLAWFISVTLTPSLLLSGKISSNTTTSPAQAQDAPSCQCLQHDQQDTPDLEPIIEIIHKVNTTNEDVLRHEIQQMQVQIQELHQELFRTAQSIPAPKVIEVEKLIPTKDTELEADLDFVINVVNEIAARQEHVLNAFSTLKVTLQEHDQQAHERLLALSTGVTPTSNEDIQQRFQEIQHVMNEVKQVKAQQVLQLEEQLQALHQQANSIGDHLHVVETTSNELKYNYRQHEEHINQMHSTVQMVWQAFVHYREASTEMIKTLQQKCQKTSKSPQQECPAVEEIPSLDEEEVKRIVQDSLVPFLRQLEEAKMHKQEKGSVAKKAEVVASNKHVENDDKIPSVDYALLTTGTRVVSEYTSPRYLPEQYRLDEKLKTAAAAVGLPSDAIPNIDGQQFFDNFGFDYGVGSANEAIKATLEKGQCWGMKGSEGDLVLKLSSPVFVSSVSIDHISK